MKNPLKETSEGPWIKRQNVCEQINNRRMYLQWFCGACQLKNPQRARKQIHLN